MFLNTAYLWRWWMSLISCLFICSGGFFKQWECFLKLLCVEHFLPLKRSCQIVKVVRGHQVLVICQCGCRSQPLVQPLRPSVSLTEMCLTLPLHPLQHHTLIISRNWRRNVCEYLMFLANRLRTHKVGRLQLDRIVRATLSDDGCTNQTKLKCFYQI